MSLPQSLGVSLKKFQGASHTQQKISLSSLGTVGSSGQLVFPLPRSGVIDLQSIAVLATLNLTSAGTITTPPLHSAMFRRVSFQMGSGNTVSLTRCADYGFAYLMSRVYGANKSYNDYKQTVAKEGNVSITSATDTPVMLASDFLGFLSGKYCRYLPMDLLPDCYIVIDLKDISNWNVGAGTITAGGIKDARLLYNRIDFQDNLLANLWADRVSKAPIQIAYEDCSYMEGTTVASAGSSTYTGFINSQSVDYILATHRPSAYASGYATASYTANNGGDGSTTNQVFWNGVPLSSFAMGLEDSLWATQSALNGSGNMLFAPDFTINGAVSASGNEFRDSFFALIYRMKLDTDAHEGSFLTGTPTFGSTATIDAVVGGATSTSRKPVLVVFSTGVLEVSAGKQAIATL